MRVQAQNMTMLCSTACARTLSTQTHKLVLLFLRGDSTQPCSYRHSTQHAYGFSLRAARKEPQLRGCGIGRALKISMRSMRFVTLLQNI